VVLLSIGLEGHYFNKYIKRQNTVILFKQEAVSST
jgi:hypothetical protein